MTPTDANRNPHTPIARQARTVKRALDPLARRGGALDRPSALATVEPARQRANLVRRALLSRHGQPVALCGVRTQLRIASPEWNGRRARSPRLLGQASGRHAQLQCELRVLVRNASGWLAPPLRHTWGEVFAALRDGRHLRTRGDARLLCFARLIGVDRYGRRPLRVRFLLSRLTSL